MGKLAQTLATDMIGHSMEYLKSEFNRLNAESTAMQMIIKDYYDKTYLSDGFERINEMAKHFLPKENND